ncbi:MAG TPA: AAA family ATPase, partial [Steroidobacteraceae bacterium]|nr:AAA family ATPase [Steroidobacteraceae bacterium]
SEFDHIATTQLHWEQQAARSSSPLLVCDTDSFATGIWHERYLRSASNEVQSIAQRAVPRLGYILTSWRDVDFHQDGIRDGEHIREWMHDQFASRIPTVGTPWMLASGSAEQRLEAALEWIDKLLPTAWQFADPLG